MKALSIRQPWASLIADGEKTIEVRSWPTHYRGPLLIVASKTRCGDLPTGCALAVADLVDCRPVTAADVDAACCDLYDDDIAWVLENVRPIEPFPVKGKLSLYEVPTPSLQPAAARR